MTLEEAIYYRMSTFAALTALVSTRIYPGAIPQDAALPAIAFEKIAGSPQLTHSGPNGWADSTVQFTVAAETFEAKKLIADQVRACWHGFSGTITPSTTESLTIGLARVVDQSGVDENQLTAALGERVDVVLIHEVQG